VRNSEALRSYRKTVKRADCFSCRFWVIETNKAKPSAHLRSSVNHDPAWDNLSESWKHSPELPCAHVIWDVKNEKVAMSWTANLCSFLESLPRVAANAEHWSQDAWSRCVMGKSVYLLLKMKVCDSLKSWHFLRWLRPWTRVICWLLKRRHWIISSKAIVNSFGSWRVNLDSSLMKCQILLILRKLACLELLQVKKWSRRSPSALSSNRIVVIWPPFWSLS